jgi:2-C-methyl-D-erythritol 4-phosphate cytidylyltransferase
MIDCDKVSVIIPAAGTGSRMQSSCHKQFIELNGKPIILHTLEKFESSSLVDDVVVVTGEEDIESVQELTKKLSKIKNIICGGQQRQDSVWNGLQKLTSQNTDIVIIHDAVRPFVTQKLIHSVVTAALKNGAAVAGVLPKETIKLTDQNSLVRFTPSRETLRIVQTPQAFQFDLLYRSFEQAIKDKFYGTDDASLVERLGTNVLVVEGEYNNIKITTPEDLKLAQLILMGF